MPSAGRTRRVIYDQPGREVAKLLDGVLPERIHGAEFAGTSISNARTGWYPRSTTFSPLNTPHDNNGVNLFVI